MFRTVSILLVLLCSLAARPAGADGITLIVSLDGFRWDYPEAFDTPFLNRIGAEGVKAVVTPAFPSKTFPNHYTLATGLVPDRHGLIANKFEDKATGRFFQLSDSLMRRDGRFFGGEPVWLTAKRQGVRSATVFWVGSDVAIQGAYPDYWRDYQREQIPPAERVEEVVQLLSLPESVRPRLVMLYFEEPDLSGHKYGPISRPTRKAMEQMDSLLEVLWNRVQALPVGPKVDFIVTGDHGMTAVSPERQIFPKDHLPSHWVRRMAGDLPTLVYATEPQYVDSIVNALSRVDHLRAWRGGEVPAYLDYGRHPNTADVVVLPDVGWVFDNTPWPNGGTHGYDPTAADMWVAFRAIGPSFKRGYTRPKTFRNVSVYPLLCHLLGITPAHNDGSLDEVSDMLR